MTDPQTGFVSDPWTLYSNTRDRFIALVRPLDLTAAEQVVPLTPGWTIRDVLAHLVGLNADVADGMREGMGTDERTAHQVASRSERTVVQLCEEWLGLARPMEAAVAEDGFFGRRLSADLVVHLHDVQHALGVAIDRTDEATVSGGHTYAIRIPGLVEAATGVRLMIDLGDGARFEPDATEPGASAGGSARSLTLRATPYDVLRSVTGRRSRAQVRDLDWDGNPEPVLDHLCPYGPLRSEPAAI